MSGSQQADRGIDDPPKTSAEAAQILSPIYPASFLSFPVADFSRHSREQYSDNFEPAPIARSAGIQVPHATQRTSLFSDFIAPLRWLAFAAGVSTPRKKLRTFLMMEI